LVCLQFVLCFVALRRLPDAFDKFAMILQLPSLGTEAQSTPQFWQVNKAMAVRVHAPSWHDYTSQSADS
jgi:hypothetical protein